MALACAWSIGLRGVDGEVVEIEADIGQGLPGVSLVGLPDAALAESRDRVRAAVVNSGETWPARRITLALSPATLPKQGSGYDLALACSVLAAAGAVPLARLRGVVLLGELALDGRVRGVRGVLPALLAARRLGVERVVVPAAAAVEAGLVEGLEVFGAEHLSDVLAWLRGKHGTLGAVRAGARPRGGAPPDDLADVVGQLAARRAVEIAAAGGHHLLMVGPPGSGKTMLARRMTGLLPDLDVDAALQVAAVRSLAGALDPQEALPAAPPFVAPHHSVSSAALVGGGSGLARPGAVSLAHRGVLFLDEMLRVRPARAGDAAHAARGRRGPPGAHRRRRPLSRPLPAGDGGQPVPVRAAPGHRLHLLEPHEAPLRGAAVGSDARPRRPAGVVAGGRGAVLGRRAHRGARGGAGGHRGASGRGSSRPGRRPANGGATRGGPPTPRCPGPSCAGAGGSRTTPPRSSSASCAPGR